MHDILNSNSDRADVACVLMYHGVFSSANVSGVTNYWRYNIRRHTLEQHLAYLSRHCNPISLSELCAGARPPGKKPNVVVTFDDGYENNYLLAFPLLKRYRIPAVFALPTAFVYHREPLWNDLVEYSVNNAASEQVVIRWARVTRRFSIAHRVGRVELYKWLMHQCVRMRQERRAGFIETMADALGTPFRAPEFFQNADYRPLTIPQILEMADSGLIEFASHSVHHYLLTNVRRSQRIRELQESKDQVEMITGRPCTTFSVPGGMYNRAVLQDSVTAGYRTTLTSMHGSPAVGGRVLPRNVVLDGDDVRVLAKKIGGLR